MVITSQAMRRNKKRQETKRVEVTKILRDDLESKKDAAAKQTDKK